METVLSQNRYDEKGRGSGQTLRRIYGGLSLVLLLLLTSCAFMSPRYALRGVQNEWIEVEKRIIKGYAVGRIDKGEVAQFKTAGQLFRKVAGKVRKRILATPDDEMPWPMTTDEKDILNEILDHWGAIADERKL